MDAVDALFAAPPDVTVEFLEAAILQPGVVAEVIDLVPGTRLLDAFQRFGVVLELGEPDEVGYRIALC